ncbi:hypothetical protein [Salibacterium aidingense]|uniref:hypothetical protein n=1 Tax=Salibacterium aidingense TaxID=384933 RepID=UPI00146FA5BE|nr:hypothetical protein [Salibacterium aidingense]
MKNQEHTENYEMDEDRMINEGLAGGTVRQVYDTPQIENARKLKKEKPPHRQ